MNPIVSIIVPCYNHACYLPDALQSVIAQTYKHWECVVVNDASTDDTIEVASKFVHKDNRIRLVNAEKNCGLAAARNLGIAHSKGVFILPLDADDRIDSAYLKTTVPHLSTNAKLKIVFTDALHFGIHQNLQKWKPFSLSELCMQNCLHCTALYRRDDYNRTEGYRLNMCFGYEDWDFWMQLLSSENEIRHIPLPLLFIRAKENAMHLDLIGNMSKERQMRHLLRHNNPSFFQRFTNKPSKSILNFVWRKLKNVFA